MKLVIEYGSNYTEAAAELKLGLQQLITIENPLFQHVVGLWFVPVENVDAFKVLTNKVERLIFNKDALWRLPTAQEIADYVKDTGD